MHEKTIVEELVFQTVAQAREKGITRITKVHVKLGEDSHITQGALGSWFGLLKEGTAVESAELEIEDGEGCSVYLMAIHGMG